VRACVRACVSNLENKQDVSISLIQSTYPQQCCRLTEDRNVAGLLANCQLLEPVGTCIPDIAAFSFYCTDRPHNHERDRD